MKCLVISPKNGVIRVSRFTAVRVQPSGAVQPAGGPELAIEFRDLDDRHAAPLRLSETLQARLDTCGEEHLARKD